MTDLSTRFLVCAACCLYLLLGVALTPYAGIQNDEALFATPIYTFTPNNLTVTIFRHQVPLMVMSYLGTLKTLLYVPIFTILGVTVWSIRIPMVCAGALTIFILFNLTRRSAGRRVALLVILLLATDPIFLVANTFDWGPVALQHLLLVTACFFLVRFAQDAVEGGASRYPDLVLGFFCLGLALWNKAIFVWALTGLVCGGLAVFRPEIQRALRLGTAMVATAAFLFGALPLVIYNIRHPNVTIASNAHMEAANLGGKVLTARDTLNGSGLLAFLTVEEWAGDPKTPASPDGRAATWIRAHMGEHRRNGMVHALALALLAVPLWWRSRAARFSLVFLATAWIAMALTRDAGGAAHHTVLLWPFPHLFIAATLDSLRPPRIAALVAAALVVMNLLVVNQYLYQFSRYGAEGNFTDAIFALSRAFPDPPPEPGRPIYITDWGMVNTLVLLHQGRLLFRVANDPFMSDQPSELERSQIAVMLSDSKALFAGHVPAREVLAGVSQRLDRAAESAGYRKHLLRTIADTNGRPVFEIFRFER